jgi:Flp pilus assembly protein protease CpaA
MKRAAAILLVTAIAVGTNVSARSAELHSDEYGGGGDVKFVTVACLWIGLHCLFLFSITLFVLIALHAFAACMGWAPTKPMAGRLAIPYAPSVAGALIATALFGCH